MKILAPITASALLTLPAFSPSVAEPAPAPVWTWEARDAGDAVFDGTRVLVFPEVQDLYNPAEGFTVDVRFRPAEASRLAGILSEYRGSRDGAWYVAMGSRAPHLNLHLVAVDARPYPAGYSSLASRTPLRLNEWHTLRLVFDGTRFTLVLDGESVGTMELEDRLLRPEQGVFRIGSRGSAHFTGDISSVYLYDRALPVPEPVGVNWIENSSFEHGAVLADALTWHRMTGTPSTVVEMAGAWVLDETESWHGRRSLRGNGSAPLVITEDVWAESAQDQPWVFSAYMKADRPGLACDLSVGAYWRLTEETRTHRVELGTEWARYELAVDDIPRMHRRGARLQGPVNFTIVPRGQGTVWVDAMQWEPGGKALAYNPEGPEARRGEAAPTVFDPVPFEARPDSPGGTFTASVPLRIHRDGTGLAGRQPASLGVPFNRGSWNGRGRVRLASPEGREIPVQTEIMNRWPDRTVQTLGVFFTDEFAPGWSNYTLIAEPGDGEAGDAPAPRWTVGMPDEPGMLWGPIADAEERPLLGPGHLQGVAMDGTIYTSRGDTGATWIRERSGPLHQVLRSTGRLLNPDSEAWLAYVARVHTWRDIPGIKIELTLINTRTGAGAVRLRTVYWQAKEPDAAADSMRLPDGVAAPQNGPVRLTSYYEPGPHTFVLRTDHPEGVRLWPGREPLAAATVRVARTLVVQALEGWERNPSALAWAGGEWRGYLWPGDPVRSVALPRGMALHREFWVREPDGAEAPDATRAWDTDVIAIAAPEWWGKTHALIPFSAAHPERFPFIEASLGGEDMLSRIGPERVESSRAYGAFDFGDHHGDGGWANLESFTDYAALVSGLRGGCETSLRIGLRAARHYRDIDMCQMTGACYTHNLSHAMGPASFSHSWPEGVTTHHLLTTSLRSLEVVRRHGDLLLAMAADARGLLGTRNLGRFVTNAANVYALTGDDRLRARVLEQVAEAEKMLAEDADNPDRSVFSNLGRWQHRRLVPYHAWYGVAALQKMAWMTGATALDRRISADIEAALHPELHFLDLEELWPGLPPAEGMPIMAADFARGRGSFMYPVLATEAATRHRPELARFALDSLYTWAVEGRNTNSIEAIIASTPLNYVPDDIREEDLIERARDLLWRAAADRLMNGDFEQSADYWHHWRPFPGKSMAHHTNWQRQRQGMASLDGDVRRVGARSLRLNLRRGGFQERLSVDHHRFRLVPGRYRLSGWVRWDAGAMPPAMGLQVRNLNGTFRTIRATLSERDSATVDGGMRAGQELPLPEFIEIAGADVRPPDGNGWREVVLHLTVGTRSVANVLLSSSLAPGAHEGHAWFDGFVLAPAAGSVE